MPENTLDDRGTTQDEAHSMLVTLCEDGFDGNIGEFAAAIGRSYEDAENLISGEEEIDEDLLMKIRGVAEGHGLELE